MDCMNKIFKNRGEDKEEKKEEQKQNIVINTDNKSQSKEEDTPLTLSEYLNIMDGLIERSGQIIIYDTNHIEHLDPAILRPGRIDIKIKFDKTSIENVKKIIKNYYKIEEEIEEIDDEYDRKYTNAQWFNKCYQNETYEGLLESLE